MALSEYRLSVLERFGDGDVQDLVAELRELRAFKEAVLDAEMRTHLILGTVPATEKEQ